MKKIFNWYCEHVFIITFTYIAALTVFCSCTSHSRLTAELNKYKELKSLSDSIIYDSDYLDTHGDDLTASYLELSCKLNK